MSNSLSFLHDPGNATKFTISHSRYHLSGTFTTIIDPEFDIPVIAPIVAQMVFSSGKTIPSETEMTLIKQAVRWAWQQEGNAAGIDTVHEYLAHYDLSPPRATSRTIRRSSWTRRSGSGSGGWPLIRSPIYVFTSDASEIAEIEAMVDGGVSYEDAIREMVKKYRS